MMLDRDKITFWTRLGAIALAVIFVGSFVVLGGGSNVNLNLLDLLGGSSGAQEDQQQTTSPQEQITQAQQELEEDPENPKIIRRLAGLYIQNGQTDEAAEVLQRGREVAPDDPVIPLYLGQAYERAGDKGRAIQYWNDYLELEPDGEQADAVKERIASLLEGEQTTPGAAGP